MKKTKKNYVVIVLVVLLLALAVGYAAFSETLLISGTVKGTGTWDVHFKSGTLKDSEGNADTTHGTVTVEATEITAAVDLAYPGDGTVLEAVIENTGTVPAKLVNCTLSGEATTDEHIEIIAANPVNGETLAANGGTCTVQYVVKWKETSEATTLGTKAFTVTFDYEQDTTAFDATPEHSDTTPNT